MPRSARPPRALRSAGGAVVLMLTAPMPALAHFGAGDADDPVQQYGVLVFLAAVVLIGAGVLTWVMLSPTDGDELSDDEADKPPVSDRGTSR